MHLRLMPVALRCVVELPVKLPAVSRVCLCGCRGCDLLLHLLVHRATGGLDALDDGSPLLELFPHVLDGALKYQALGATLSLEPWYQLRQPVEALADGLASLLLCRGSVEAHQRTGSQSMDRTRRNVILLLLGLSQAWLLICAVRPIAPLGRLRRRRLFRRRGHFFDVSLRR
jgi:hypothetical protein